VAQPDRRDDGVHGEEGRGVAMLRCYSPVQYGDAAAAAAAAACRPAPMLRGLPRIEVSRVQPGSVGWAACRVVLGQTRAVFLHRSMMAPSRVLLGRKRVPVSKNAWSKRAIPEPVRRATP